MEYLVTTNSKTLEQKQSGCQVFMVDGTVPGWQPREFDYIFDHHRKGGAYIQIDEIPPLEHLEINHDLSALIVTTQVDADACVAAAYLQLPKIYLDADNLDRLRAIAFDCDYLGVPKSLENYADFAAQCVAAMKSDSNKLIKTLNLPSDRREWTVDQKTLFTSAAFKQGTEALVDACKGKRKFPGELGEAEAYWQEVEQNTQLLIAENRVTIYRDCLLINCKGLGGKYIDPRCALRVPNQCKLPVSLTVRDVYVDGEFKGYSYTLGHIPFHPKLKSLDYALAYESLTKTERKNNPSCDPWGGRKNVGGSGWTTPSTLTPEEVIDVLFDVLGLESLA